MRLGKAAAFVLVAALLGVAGWAAYRAVWVEHVARAKACAEESSEALFKDSVIEYGHSSSGAVGTYITLLSINKSGHARLGHGLGVPWPGAGDTQLASEELDNLLRTIQRAKFVDFRQCYGQRAPVNPQNTWMVYRWDGNEKRVLWMTPPTGPKPPGGWFRIVEILDQIQARGEAGPGTVRCFAASLDPSAKAQLMEGTWRRRFFFPFLWCWRGHLTDRNLLRVKLRRQVLKEIKSPQGNSSC